MINLVYLLEASLSLILFLGLYQLTLARLTFFSSNRVYLVAGLLCSVLVPLLPLPWLGGWMTTQPAYPSVPQLITWSVRSSPSVPSARTLPTLMAIVSGGYWLLVGYKLLQLVRDIYAVLRLTQQYPQQVWGSTRLVWVEDSIPVSSFFHYIFLPNQSWQGEALKLALLHEEVHCRQWHSVDLLLVRLMKAFFWFNPLMSRWQQALVLTHEYLADAQAITQYDPTTYAHWLVKLASGPTPFSTLHFLSTSQIKSRILMIHQLRSKAAYRLSFLLTAPLVGFMLTVVSCEQVLNRADIRPSSLAKEAYLFPALIGKWTNIDRTTINNNDGQTPRDVPERAGDLQACSSELELKANGQFAMRDDKTGQSWQGSWSSDAVGVSVQLHYLNKASTTESTLPEYFYTRDGSLAIGPFPKTIYLDITSLKAGKLEAWQSYGANDGLSGGTIYYQYLKQ